MSEQRSEIRFGAWNMAGRWSFRVGRMLYRVGLWLCGLGGSLDARADRFR